MMNNASDHSTFKVAPAANTWPNQSIKSSPSQLAALSQYLGQHLLRWLTEGSNLQITQQTQAGTKVWQVYDPITDKTLQFEHEESLRAWIDQRYNE